MSRYKRESELVAELRKRFPPGPGVEIGIGDDAAVVKVGDTALITTDMLVEGVHFTQGQEADTGELAMIANISDIAAMGGRPLYAVVSVGLPKDAEFDLDSFMDGLADLDVPVVGGDTVSAPCVCISIAMIGEPGPAGPVLRSGAQSGDLLCVTGRLGARSAVVLLRKEIDASGRDYPKGGMTTLMSARSRGRVREGMAAAGAGAKAMIDVSDGLGTDADHLAEGSGTGLRVLASNVPVADGVTEAAGFLGIDAVRLVVTGGEDYELLIAIHPHDLEMLRDAVAPTDLSVVGEFTNGAAREIEWPDGSHEPLSGLGWDHLA